ncbi:MAG TPA: AbrB/MazE/SpoVT family DNA-binding domain-containing protein [Candidatus Thiothrix moscowensis]|uniref:AbrB/MazE/SpoVT family DNA-binding domain-containing protein n=1 Tax=unclassified Thiothrix TaxID=2636184 RepID=UPI0025D165E7|nr:MULTISPECIES: AbrB/MazE/SpoVT family DNA-binding domain-containing protein [unclassified Thiothrix]HRJ54525.1 AbrB/MazE/SpoVT family DNA-binding domain-containing protein [Candidatus Thiothrix moscowensis]HRJ94907.1 AbrB/MazE/SpoVT family DNA-binding domain-containing protein [Candidatus Thiothrix moscowensis]
MLQVNLTAIGDSVGIVLPKEVREKLNVSEGDSLSPLESSEGFILTRHQRDFDEQMYAAKKVLHKYGSAFSELAK